MRLMFSVVALLIVAALAMWIAKQQLQAVNALGPAAGASAAPGSPPQPLPQRVQQDVQRALEQGAARASAAEP
jgi:hypothetical protein